MPCESGKRYKKLLRGNKRNFGRANAIPFGWLSPLVKAWSCRGVDWSYCWSSGNGHALQPAPFGTMSIFPVLFLIGPQCHLRRFAVPLTWNSMNLLPSPTCFLCPPLPLSPHLIRLPPPPPFLFGFPPPTFPFFFSSPHVSGPPFPPLLLTFFPFYLPSPPALPFPYPSHFHDPPTPTSFQEQVLRSPIRPSTSLGSS